MQIFHAFSHIQPSPARPKTRADSPPATSHLWPSGHIRPSGKMAIRPHPAGHLRPHGHVRPPAAPGHPATSGHRPHPTDDRPPVATGQAGRPPTKKVYPPVTSMSFSFGPEKSLPCSPLCFALQVHNVTTHWMDGSILVAPVLREDSTHEAQQQLSLGHRCSARVNMA